MGILIVAALVYLLLTLFLTVLAHQIPRRPVRDRPDWGHIRDIQIPAIDGGMLETWIVEPDMPSKGTVSAGPWLEPKPGPHDSSGPCFRQAGV